LDEVYSVLTTSFEGSHPDDAVNHNEHH